MLPRTPFERIWIREAARSPGSAGGLSRDRAAKAAKGIPMFAACGQIIKTDLTKY